MKILDFEKLIKNIQKKNLYKFANEEVFNFL